MRSVYAWIQRVIEYGYKITPGAGKVLMFHQVRDDGDFILRADFCMRTSSFKAMLEEYQRLGMKFCPVANILVNSNKDHVYVTFDDGFEDVYLYAYPILRELKVPFCIFVAIDYINKKGYLTSQMIKTLSKDPLCTIGSHTVTHPRLRFCENPEYEIQHSKDMLEEITGNRVECFAYPYGSISACSLANMNRVKASGYKFAFSAISGHLNLFSNRGRYFLPRVNVNENMYRRIIHKN